MEAQLVNALPGRCSRIKAVRLQEVIQACGESLRAGDRHD